MIEIYPHEPQTVRTGESAMLTCRAIGGIPTPNVVWSRRDRRPLPHNTDERYPGAMVISNITFIDGGEYECRASNIAGEVSQTTTIHVQSPPVIRIIPDQPQLTITEGDELKLDCIAEGIPAPSVNWQLPNEDGTTRVFDATHFGAPSLNRPQGSFHKYNVDRRDEGTYVCHAKNDAGEDQRYITVIVEPKRGDVGKYLENLIFFFFIF